MRHTNTLTLLAASAIITILCMLTYATVQQTYRTAANDPQLQIAREIKYRLENNKSTNVLSFGDTVDLSQSLSSFQTLYNEKGEALQSTGFLHTKFPQPPSGVFVAAKNKGENAFTWQPEKDVRIAMVLIPVHSQQAAYVASGSSLKEVEIRESNHLTMVMLAWAACMGIVFVHWVINWFSKRKQQAV